MRILAITVLSVFLLNCTERETVNIGGSTTVLPVISKAAETYRENNPDIRIIVNAGGSGVGINQVGEGKLEIGMTSRDITEQEKTKYPEIDFNVISIGKDAVVPVVSSEIYEAGITTLSLQQIRDIYSGKIINWSDLGGPDMDILCIDKETSRGTRHVFMKAVFGDKEAEAQGADLVLGSNNEEQTALTQSNSAIGMLSNAWLNDDVRGLTILMPNGDKIEPTLENIVNGTFPITRDLLIVTAGPAKGITKQFIDYVLSDQGQTLVEEAGYVRINQ
ncbi:MAG: phosphate ABC transporter substrate-binding protein [Balneola sp.]|jgi:phosphate transport system substrate-binding protein